MLFVILAVDDTIKLNPELQKNILKFGYSINYKYEEVWYSLEQYIGLKEDKLSSTTVDFIRSEGNLETKRLYWFSKPKMC